MNKNFLRFGVEFEVNSFDLKDRPDNFSLPLGSHEIATIINESLNQKVFISNWVQNHYNNSWYVKPDSSCGIEICSPVLKGDCGIKQISMLAKSLRKNKIKSDKRCSFHVHFDVSNFKRKEVLSIICWWIKLEAFFVDMLPNHRKCNHFCKLISQSNIIKSVSNKYNFNYFLKELGKSKYYTLNTHHYYRNKRKTLEFRIIDSKACLNEKDSFFWLKLLTRFIETAIKKGHSLPYKKGNPFTGYCWLDPIDVFNFLDFLPDTRNEDLDLINWIISKLTKNGNRFLLNGVFSSNYRIESYKESCKLEKIFKEL